MKKWISFILIAAMLFSFAGCNNTNNEGQPNSGNNTSSENSESSGSTKDTFNFGFSGEPTTFDPSATKDSVSLLYLYQIYDRLLEQNPENPKEYIPGLATEWVFSEDSKEITFTIREGVKFQNGELLNTEDLVWALELVRNGGFTSHLNSAIDHFEKVDDTHIKVILNYPYSSILDVLSNPNYSVVNRKAWEEAQAAGKDFGREPVGSGAYQLVEWRNGTSMEFEAFADYWGGAPAIKHIKGTNISDNSSAAIALEDGTIDWSYSLSKSDFAHLSELPQLQRIEGPNVGVYHISFNCQDGPFSDLKLRQAVAFALNVDDIIVAAAEGLGIPADCFVPSTVPGYVADNNWFQQDVEKAKQLVAEAGYPDGLTVNFGACTDGAWMAAIEIIQEQLRQIGINCELNKMDRAAYLEDVANQMDYNITYWAINANVCDADFVVTRRFHSSQIGQTNNFSNYANPAADELIEAARAELDETKRLELYSQLYAILKEDLPYVPVYSGMETTFFASGLRGVYSHPMGRYTWKNFYWAD